MQHLGAFGPLPRDVLLALAHEHLAGLTGVSFAPDIPRRKLRGARAAHAVHLDVDEPILVLFDNTVLGSGSDGFIATPAQLCWKNFLEYPRRIRWDDLADRPIVELEERVELARGRVPAPWLLDGPERLRNFLIACGRRTGAGGSAAPYRDRVRVRDLRTWADALVAVARDILGELDWLHYHPSIPAKMLTAARIVHEKHLSPSEEILVLYDDTLLGAGNDGVVLTERAVYWRNFWGSAEVIAWSDIDPDVLSADGDLLFVDSKAREQTVAPRRKIDLRMRPGMARLVERTLRELSGMSGQPR